MIIAILLALLSAFLVYQYLNRTTETVVEETPTVEVVVAAQNIPQDVEITREMLTTMELEPAFRHPQAFESIDDVVGGISKSELYRDEQILKPRIFHGEQKAKFSYRIPENRRALAIAMGEVVAVSGLLDVGDYVDILVTMTPSPAEGTAEGTAAPKPRTFTMLQNMEILAIGDQVVTADDGKQHLASSMTLSVTPEEAQLITFAEQHGAFRLTLRNPVDQREIPLDPFTQDDFDQLGQ
jgi:pilus assembly protein CpaB